MEFLSDKITTAAEFSLDALAFRKRVSADNVANALTPGFRAGRVDFEASLAAAMAAGDPQRARVTVSTSTAAPGPDGNNVQLENELVGSGGLQYSALVQVLNYKHALLRTALARR